VYCGICKIIIVLALTFFSKNIYSQSLSRIQEIKTVRLHIDSSLIPWKANTIISKDAYVKNLAFFCRQELRIEKALRVPLRFRVGSLAYCNFLEGKK